MAALPIAAESAGVLTMNFTTEVNAAMRMLAQDARTVFVGQSVRYGGATMYYTLEGVPEDKRLEMPVIEDFQLGFCLGLSMIGRLPVCIYPRFDFLLLAMNQLVNHLDRLCEMGDFRPKVIVRTRVGPKQPLDAGPQHSGNYTTALCSMLRNVRVFELTSADQVMPVYTRALEYPESCLIVENGNG